MHWENEFSSSRSKNIPFFFPAELRGLPQPLLKLQVELLLPVRTAQGIGRKAQGFARPVESSESLGYISTWAAPTVSSRGSFPSPPNCTYGRFPLQVSQQVQDARGGSRRGNHVTLLCPFFWESKGPPFSRTSGYPSPDGPPKCPQGKAVK